MRRTPLRDLDERLEGRLLPLFTDLFAPIDGNAILTYDDHAMGLAYRFRSATHLLDFKELEDQYIYFCSPQELNDPEEGVRNTVWKGDRIVWTNLFRHYLLCLQVYYVTLQREGHNRTLTTDDIHVKGLIDVPAARRGVHAPADLFNDKVFRDASIADLVVSIGDRFIRYGEMLQYLELLHTCAVTALPEIFARDSTLTGSGSKVQPDKLSQIMSLVDAKVRSSVADWSAAIVDDIKLRLRLEQPDLRNPLERNWQNLVFDFPRNYLDRLDSLLYPRWYIACFTDDIRNSSMWGHYADAHRGVCLIFATDNEDSGESITLSCITGYSSTNTRYKEHWSPVPMKLFSIEYGTTRRETDFFRCMGNVPKNELFALWYTDESGQVSGLSRDVGQERWRDEYWIRFFPDITNKSIDWRYEKERRLVLDGGFSEFEKVEERKLPYEFRTLKGIIFGIRTSIETKKHIIRVLAEKCKTEKRADFELYQAHYNSSDGSIGKRRITIPGFAH